VTRYPIRVLIIDDSAYMRKALRAMLESSPFIEVVDTARNGIDALDKIQQINPDVVTVDLFMPEMDGVTFLREIMARAPVPVVVCSSAGDNAEQALTAMESGAVEFVQKPTALALDVTYNIQKELVRAVLAAAEIPPEKISGLPNGVHTAEPVIFPGWIEERRADAILIGISTGGPRALQSLLPRLPENFPVAIAIALHMPPGYTGPLARRLNDMSAVEVIESADRIEMMPGRVLLAQAGFHTLLERQADGKVVARLNEEPRSSLYMPSVDVLFHSGAEAYQGRVVGIVMTGMGNDGTAGAAWIKSMGGRVMAEDETSSVVYGMPRSVVEAGLADRVVSLAQIPDAMMEMIL
jgi:two-component system, chemotaxis family, protein-glutamate methylesterase/glutaminase